IPKGQRTRTRLPSGYLSGRQATLLRSGRSVRPSPNLLLLTFRGCPSHCIARITWVNEPLSPADSEAEKPAAETAADASPADATPDDSMQADGPAQGELVAHDAEEDGDAVSAWTPEP